MDFIIIANAWSAGRDNPTSKHRIAIELVRQGHRVLWIEGSGMRTPSVGSSSDRLRMVRKVVAAFRGARKETLTPALSPEGRGGSTSSSPFRGEDRGEGVPLHILSPLFLPLPRYELARRLNGLICRWSMRFWGWWLGFHDPVLINYVPVLAEAMRCRRRRRTINHRPKTLDQCEAPGGRGLSEPQPKDGSHEVRPPEECSTLLPRVVYHCVDRWDAFAMYDSAMMGEMDRRCCRYADLVIASAGELFDRCKAINPNTVLIPHGVDWEHFRQAAPEMLNLGQRESSVWGGCPHPPYSSHSRQADEDIRPTSEKSSIPASGPVIGFFGLLSEWVDQDLLLRLAREFSDNPPLPSGEPPTPYGYVEPRRAGVRVSAPLAKIVLIGKADVDVSRLQGLPNIQLLGPIPFAELPIHIAGFTVGIIPFVVNDLTRSVNPIKLREMLSAGCPVVSTALPEVARYAGSGTEELLSCRVAELLSESPEVSSISSLTTEQPNNSATIPGGASSATEQPNNLTTHQCVPPVQIACDHDEFVAMVRRVLENPLTPDERRAVSDSMAGETWTAKVGEIISLLSSED